MTIKPKNRNGIYWFRHDLRVEDNQAFYRLAQNVEHLLCIYVIDPRWFKPAHFQSAHMGTHRWQFLCQSLQDLQRQLTELGQRLLIFEGEPYAVLANLIDQNDISQVSSGSHPGVYERQQWQRLKDSYSAITFGQSNNHCLFSPAQLPFEVDELPVNFTPFRKLVENVDLSAPFEAVTSLPPALNCASSFPLFNLPGDKQTSQRFVGGQSAGYTQLNDYLTGTHRVKSYKQTRNGLDGWDYSSKLSPWLANGSLSPKQVYHQLKSYEDEYGDNESTYWLFFELLWREYFQWYLFKHQSALFKFEGVQQKRPLTTFMAQRFTRWKQGETPYPIVNACMNQLNHTGYMSNRGRQLVASCLVHELGIDWRYGAAYFEQQLIDFDVASNWGNWQYLAGVGADPRGHRRFDLEKQTRQYDPKGTFIKRWQASKNSVPLDTTDAADWPIS